jgi:PH/SEC7 domain-containing protein
MHHSTASSSEPSLIAAIGAADKPSLDLPFIQFDDMLKRGTGLVASTSSAVSSRQRRASSQTLETTSPALRSTSSTPIITGLDDGAEEDLETRAKALAARCWNEEEDFLAKEKIAEWLGGL